MKKKILVLFLIVFLLGVNVTNVFAQNYHFQVSREDVTVTVSPYGTVAVEYSFVFVNDSGASPIDYVDVGVPTSNYYHQLVTAEVNGTRITDIQSSQYVTPGVALGLGGNAIPPGQQGTVHVIIPVVRDDIFPGTAKESEPYASFQFSPNWFDSKYVSGNTELTVTLVLPPGMKSEEPRYYPAKSWPDNSPPETGMDDQGRVFYRWHSTSADAHTQYIFGASFPTHFIPAGAISTPTLPVSSIATSHPIQPGDSRNFLVFMAVMVVFGILFHLMTVGERSRKLDYLPPTISIEGLGVKRGLTAVEAAVLMEEPMDKILTMILFSLVKKNAAKVVTRDPLKLESASPLPDGLYTYETDFLKAFQGQLLLCRDQLQAMMIALVKSISEKMKGFSRKETVAYYKDIITQAWQEVESANTPEVKSQKFDENMDWTMLDENYNDRTRQVFSSGPIFLPIWWGNYDPDYHPSSLSTGGALSSTTGTGLSGNGFTRPSLPGSDYAALMAKRIQSFSARVIGDVNTFTSGITEKTNPIPLSTSSDSLGGLHGGGGHCACACACAGCACACAGGGR
jgi:hypothetical protein